MPYYRIPFNLDLLEESIQTNGNIIFKHEQCEFSLRCSLLNDDMVLSQFRGRFEIPTQLDTADKTEYDSVTIMLNLGNAVYYQINGLNCAKILPANSMALCYSDTRHGLCRYQPQVTQLFALQVPRSLLLEYINIMQMGGGLKPALEHREPFFLLKPTPSTLQFVALKLAEPQGHSSAIQRQLCYSFISDAVRYLLGGDTAHPQNDGNTHLERAIEILDSEYTLPPTITELARRVGTNETSLKQGFRKELNTTIHQYITQQRMARAAELLNGENYTISHIAHEVGYSNHGHFSAAFKKEFGCTPSTFLSLQSSGQPNALIKKTS
ncbi:helix-turn-helix transcriptional regulator [Vibrio cholerae]|uniref:helix-turn-helix transcriptional regulator n=1 Tax=Vibrio cholerae TaxID=666 RepID=UPI0021B15C2B|nr:AraC family transcriptional regulator [Vibrio cholerae]EKF9123664.1 helix-turn-helix transcriptional regulator [Vibrio cholerae]EKF9141945.1 helix-turn-helix transcriptional regulator [Vibrio cholerae]UWY94829.1 AraC family transcriptional regulator [Vibrio cholerae]UWY98388.1 AraC family transcriptional regulator [Vibrio cholerae]